VTVPSKYAVVERERRFLVARIPDGVEQRQEILDRYVIGTRLRLREARDEDGAVTRKLGHKVRLGVGPADVACTNFYLDDEEWTLLVALPARMLRKTRHLVRRDGLLVAVDEHDDGTLVAEIDDRNGAPQPVPQWLDVIADVSADEAWTGAQLAQGG
jgi:CYTH domain-containing protein